MGDDARHQRQNDREISEKRKGSREVHRAVMKFKQEDAAHREKNLPRSTISPQRVISEVIRFVAASGSERCFRLATEHHSPARGYVQVPDACNVASLFRASPAAAALTPQRLDHFAVQRLPAFFELGDFLRLSRRLVLRFTNVFG